MASAAAWRSIATHGLLTTEQLVDVYEVSEAARASILNSKRRTVVTIERHGMPAVVIRDQKPMKFIEEKIDPGSSLRLYLNAINARVFFWPTRDRLTRLLLSAASDDDEGVTFGGDVKSRRMHVRAGWGVVIVSRPSSCCRGRWAWLRRRCVLVSRCVPAREAARGRSSR